LSEESVKASWSVISLESSAYIRYISSQAGCPCFFGRPRDSAVDDYARIHLHLYTAPLHTHLYYVITLHIPPHTSTFDLYGLLPDPLRLTPISTNHSCSLDLLLDFSTSNLYKPLSANSVAMADRPLTKTNFLKNLETLERCDICHDPFNESHVPTRTSC
jgi:hypothetical protein